MSILLYIPEPLSTAKKLLTEINTLALGETIEIYESVQEISDRLYESTRNLTAAILVIPDRQKLIEILSIREWLQDVRIILILPDRDAYTVSLGHSLFPRFISYLDNDFTDKEVPAVLKKMCNIFIATKQKTHSQKDGPTVC
jgi:hypothetical protein